MLDIQPVSPYSPVIKPQKIKRDDNRPENRQHKKKPEVQEQEHDADPIQHIDEIV
jgi:hypothetical protein